MLFYKFCSSSRTYSVRALRRISCDAWRLKIFCLQTKPLTTSRTSACTYYIHQSWRHFSSSCISSHSDLKMANETDVTEVTEGLARVVLPKSVFYNPVQEYNRDLTIAIVSEIASQHFKNLKVGQIEGNSSRKSKQANKSWNDVGNSLAGDDDSFKLVAGQKYDNGIRIFEGLAASGLRSVRFGLEIPGVKEVIANDFDKNAVDFIERNIEKNGLKDIMKSRCGDAGMGMYEHRAVEDRFDVIDLDPYGSPTIFLDSVVQAGKDGGLLCITCTDAAVLCGNAPEKCNANYGAISLRSKFCHEMALRIILQCLDAHANRYSRYIVPLLSLSIDFYFRVFVQVFSGQRNVKHSAAKKAMVFECVGCGVHTIQPVAEAIPTKGEGNYKFVPGKGPTVPQKCIHCGHEHRMGGPIWLAPIHDRDFVKRVIERVQSGPHSFHTADRITGMLNVVLEELPDIPLFYVLDAVCGVLHCTPPNMKTVRSALLNQGYKVSLSHAAKNSYKTDAPAEFIWDIMRAWVKDNPVSEKRRAPGTVVKAILDQEQKSEVDFTEHPDANPQSREKGLLRWQPNPEPNWGPKAKAKRSSNADLSEKRAANQGKNKKVKNETDSQGECTDEQMNQD